MIPRQLSMSRLGTKLIKKAMNGNIYKPQSRHLFTSLKTIFDQEKIEDKSHLSPESIHGEIFHCYLFQLISSSFNGVSFIFEMSL
jgi:hypothetical protein